MSPEESDTRWCTPGTPSTREYLDGWELLCSCWESAVSLARVRAGGGLACAAYSAGSLLAQVGWARLRLGRRWAVPGCQSWKRRVARVSSGGAQGAWLDGAAPIRLGQWRLRGRGRGGLRDRGVRRWGLLGFGHVSLVCREVFTRPIRPGCTLGCGLRSLWRRSHPPWGGPPWGGRNLLRCRTLRLLTVSPARVGCLLRLAVVVGLALLGLALGVVVVAVRRGLVLAESTRAFSRAVFEGLVVFGNVVRHSLHSS